MKGLYKELNKLKPDLIHAHGFGFWVHDQALIRLRIQSWFLRSIGRSSYKPTIINTPHGPFMSKAESGIRDLFKKTFTFLQSLYLPQILDLAIEVNPEQEKWLTSNYRLPKERIAMHPPIMPQPIKSEQEILAAKDKKDFIQITSISRLADYKGFEDIIAAFNEANQAVKAKLFIGGAADNYTSEIGQLVKNSPRLEDIEFETDISSERRDEIFAQTDIFIFASSWEAFGIVIAEAMAYGSAIISTTTEGGKFLVKRGLNGYLYNYKDLKSLITEINNLLTNKTHLRKLQSESVKMVAEFSEDKLYNKFAATINKLFSKN